jgi:hypothetical protein
VQLIQLVFGQEPLLLVRRCLWRCLYLYISLSVLSPWRTDTDRLSFIQTILFINQYHSTPIIHMPLQLSIRHPATIQQQHRDTTGTYIQNSSQECHCVTFHSILEIHAVPHAQLLHPGSAGHLPIGSLYFFSTTLMNPTFSMNSLVWYPTPKSFPIIWPA